jgi:hypothetical protein
MAPRHSTANRSEKGKCVSRFSVSRRKNKMGKNKPTLMRIDFFTFLFWVGGWIDGEEGKKFCHGENGWRQLGNGSIPGIRAEEEVTHTPCSLSLSISLTVCSLGFHHIDCRTPTPCSSSTVFGEGAQSFFFFLKNKF